MTRLLLGFSSALLLGTIGAFFLFVSPLSIGTAVCILLALLLMFGLGVATATTEISSNEEVRTRSEMTKSEVEKFKETLTARQSELEGIIRNCEAAAIETSADALDQIQHMAEREWALDTLGRESAFLRDTRAALRRIDADAFGICVDCEEEINPKRLAAVPWAARCIACQEIADREGSAAKNDDESLLVEAA